MNGIHDVLAQIATLLKGAWRYRWLVVILAWAIALPGWIYVYKMPDEYQASARLYADTSSVLRPLLRGLAVDSGADQELQLITRTLLSRPNLERLARMTDLDLKATTAEQTNKVLNELRDGIKLASSRQHNIYTVSYTYPDPQLAKRVVQSVLNVVMEDTLGENRRDSSSAQDFLDRQIKEYEGRLIEAENRLKEFRIRNVGVMSSSQGDYYQRVESAAAALQQAKLDHKEAANRRDELARQIEEDAPSPFQFDEGTGGLGVVTAYDARIQALKVQLDEMLLQYTDAHPDVVKNRQIIEELERRREEDLKTASLQQPEQIDRPNIFKEQLKLALSEADAHVASMRARVDEYQNRLDSLRQRLNEVPEVEAEQARLNRDYNVNKRQYEELLERRETARISEQAQQNAQNVKFRIIDPPYVPPEPAGPNRPLLHAGVLFAALGAGWALAALIALLRPTFHTTRELAHALGVAVFGAVSTVEQPRDLRARMFGYVALGVVTLGLFLGYGILVAADQVNVAALLGL